MKYANKALNDCIIAVPINIVRGNPAPVIPILFINPVLTIPVGATGENAPALAPVATIIAISSGLILDFAESCIATGAISKVAAILPGPIADKMNVKKKIEIGSNFVLLPILETKESVNLDKDPFVDAIPKKSVIPTNIKNKFEGNKAVTSFSLKPNIKMPITRAKTILTIPIFTLGFTIPIIMASSKAESEIIAVNIVN